MFDSKLGAALWVLGGGQLRLVLVNSTMEFSRAEAERRLGPDVVAEIRRLVAEAPPLSVEQMEWLRAVFASARLMRDRVEAAELARREAPSA
ncbi:hypothetical protein [Streptomyces sp. BPSDS2]|uniref:hypothetical protein n=1 Tax=Streptomyces sp. BPSDS2 TaxID=2571021 RepID=UPI0010C23899|nr:hypothetical protein [Streptomyces sp. BPSDS2]